MSQYYRRHLMQLCLCIVVWAVAAQALAAEAVDPALYEAIKGRWEGTLNGEFRSQEISWHFDRDEDGALRGLIGPSLAGAPSLPMEDLAIEAGHVSFTLASQHARFDGTITPDGITGMWNQGGALPLRMEKKDFVFALSEDVRRVLVGRWDMDNAGAPIHVEFAETASGSLTGTLSSPSIGLHDAPLVDIFVTDEGFAQFATDNGRRFTGRLVNGELLGDFASAGRGTSKRKLIHVDRASTDFTLALSAAERTRLEGTWYFEVFGDDCRLEVTTTDGVTRGRLLFEEGRLKEDPLLELVVEANNVRLTSFSGRTFIGAFVGASGDEGIAGEYRNNGRPFNTTLSRNPPD